MKFITNATLTLGLLLMSHNSQAVAQLGCTEYLNNNLHTLQLKVDGSAEAFPVLKLNSNESLEVSFDDLTHEYKRYTYKIEHCDMMGQVTDGLFESEYIRATADEGIIDTYAPSENTTVQYTHYTFTLPNTQMRPLISGNYRITISSENDEGEIVPVLRTYFGVVDPQVSIYPTCSTDTEVDYNNTHQQLSLRVDVSRLTLRDAANELQVVVMQNRRWDNAIINVPFTSQNGNQLLWEHSRGLIFDAGNEFRKMEILSTRYPGMHGDGVKWMDPYYHYTIMTDYVRKNYLYDEDRNGLYLTRYEGGGNADIEADYVMAHFSLEIPQVPKAQMYVAGMWTGGRLSNRYLMHYDESKQMYLADFLLKCGYYNYQYLSEFNNMPNRGTTQVAEGDFYPTENEYDILVYYHPSGSRYWQLVGCVTPSYRKR